jgi:hypothetical protein
MKERHNYKMRVSQFRGAIPFLTASTLNRVLMPMPQEKELLYNRLWAEQF